jgi:D-sedoheptulose 7-phosphate isomerase
MLVAAARARLPILVCGNGGSAADAQHIVAELVGQFSAPRVALDVRALAADPALLTALANDFGYAEVFTRQVEAYGRPGGLLLALSTSGQSVSVLRAAEAARRCGMQVIAFTGATGGGLADLADISLLVPATEAALVQEGHAALYHYLCARIDAAFSSDATSA